MFNRTRAYFAATLIATAFMTNIQAKIMHITTEADFDAKVLKSKKPNVVAFVTKGCGPCEKIKPRLEKIAKKSEYKNINFASVDMNKSQLDEKYNIHTAPAVIFIDASGKEVDRNVGGGDSFEVEIAEKINKNFSVKK